MNHREDGPAAEYSGGTKGWYLNGKYYHEDEWKKEVAKLNKVSLTPEDKMAKVASLLKQMAEFLGT